MDTLPGEMPVLHERGRETGSMKSALTICLVCLVCLSGLAVAASAQGEVTADPAAVTVTLSPGETEHVQITVSLPGSVPKGDVIFAFDTTGSMFNIIEAMKSQGIGVMGQIRNAIPDTRFGVASFMDYPRTYTDYYKYKCQQGGPCTYGIPGDYAYRQDLDLTSDITAVSAAINNIPQGNGGDNPQDYTRVIYESQYFNWSTDAKKVFILFGDAPPHAAPNGSSLAKPWESGFVFTQDRSPYGGDPGRDEIPYTADDLDYELVIRDIAAQHIAIVGVYCPEGGQIDSGHVDAANNFKYMSYVTNGSFVLSDSTGDPIADQVVSIIKAMSKRNVGEFSLEAAEEGYRGWVVSSDVNTGVQWGSSTFFTISITPPAGTADGDYLFHLNALGDGVILATIPVAIHVQKEPTTGSIHVTSDPTGATVILDEVNTGIRTGHTFEGVTPGVHTVNVTLAGYEMAAEQKVSVTAGSTAEVSFTLVRIPVAEPAKVSIDIKPGSCPNSFNPKEKGVLPVAILGTKDLKVSSIDPKSIVLTRDGGSAGVKPTRSSLEDVASVSTKSCSCGFKSGRPDRKQDLSLKFDSQELVKKLGIEDGEGCIRVTITGTLRSSDPKVAGQAFTGSDYLQILGTGHGSCGKDSKDDKGSCDGKGGSCDKGESCDKGGSCAGKGSLNGKGSADDGNPWDDGAPSADHGHGDGRDERA